MALRFPRGIKFAVSTEKKMNVLLGIVTGQPMNLIFNSFELVAMVLAVIIVNFIVQDGESNWFEGLQLLAAYAIMAIAFFLHR